jgi:hypothetical protein
MPPLRQAAISLAAMRRKRRREYSAEKNVQPDIEADKVIFRKKRYFCTDF